MLRGSQWGQDKAIYPEILSRVTPREKVEPGNLLKEKTKQNKILPTRRNVVSVWRTHPQM